jgi:hypothetical protein
MGEAREGHTASIGSHTVVFDTDQRSVGVVRGFLGVCDSLTGGTPMSDLHALVVIFLGLAATLAVWLGTMGLSFLLH